MSAHTLQKKILLVVEDARAAAQITRLLGARGLAATASMSLSDCVRKAAQFLPDVVLLDLQHYTKSGLAAAVKLRTTPGLTLVHLVALTASQDAQTLFNMAKAGFDELLPPAPGPDRIMLSCR